MDTNAVIYTVDEFCRAHKICRSTFYNLRREGKTPRLARVGSRVLITAEAARDWRHQCEIAVAGNDPSGRSG